MPKHNGPTRANFNGIEELDAINLLYKIIYDCMQKDLENYNSQNRNVPPNKRGVLWHNPLGIAQFIATIPKFSGMELESRLKAISNMQDVLLNNNYHIPDVTAIELAKSHMLQVGQNQGLDPREMKPKPRL